MDALKEILYNLGSLCGNVIRIVLDWFHNLTFYNKVIVLNTITSFFAITLSIAKYYIFESWFGINNPLAVYLLFIVVLMFATIFIEHAAVFWVRMAVNIWYLVYLIIMLATHGFSHAPYSISFGFFFNILAPAIYMWAAFMISFYDS